MADDSASSLSYKTDQKNTPKEWKGPPDARSIKGAGTYPNYTSQKTRSGHTFTMDDSEGAESVTLQHRSGSMVQFLPDGAIQFVSHNGQYTFVFGENRVQITGAYDVTVNGGGSLKVDGDYNVTVQGNHNTTVNGDMNITAKNMNTVVRGNMDTSAKNMTTKIEGSTEITTEGVTNITSDGGLSLSSTTESVSILGQADVGIGAEGKIMFDAGGSIDLKAAGALRAESTGGSVDIKASGVVRNESGGAMSMKAGGNIGMDGSNIYLNSGSSQSADGAEDMVVSIPPPKNPNAGGPR
jgi:hypothetical protein